MLSSDELQKKLPILKNNPANYSLVATQYDFPRPRKADVGTSVQDGRVVREQEDYWIEQDVDRWVEQMRARAEQLRSLGFSGKADDDGRQTLEVSRLCDGLFDVGEQAHFERCGFGDPPRCKVCRARKKERQFARFGSNDWRRDEEGRGM